MESYKPEKILPICFCCFNGGKHPQNERYLNENHTIKINTSENRAVEFSSFLVQNVVFCIFARGKVVDACLLVHFSLQGWPYRSNYPSRSREDSFERKSNVIVPFLSIQKDWGASLPRPSFLQRYQVKIKK